VVAKDLGYKQRGLLLLLVSEILRGHVTAAEGRRTAMRFLPFSLLLSAR
jgi:hypothetical protein